MDDPRTQREALLYFWRGAVCAYITIGKPKTQDIKHLNFGEGMYIYISLYSDDIHYTQFYERFLRAAQVQRVAENWLCVNAKCFLSNDNEY